MAKDIIATALIEGLDTVEKDISLDEFLLAYNYEIKSNEEEYERIYFPPGNKEYTMNSSTNRYSLSVEDYASFYGLPENDCRYFIDITFRNDGKSVLNAKVYSYDKKFNRIISKFKLIAVIKDIIKCNDVDDGIRKVLEKRNDILYRVRNSEEVSYSAIKQK